MVSDLVDYLYNNLLIAHYCGFDISRPLPSYWTFDRFLKNFDNSLLSNIMISQVLLLADKGIVDTSFIGLDSTPISANTSKNNPMRKNTSSIGTTKTMSLWTASQGFPFTKPLRLPKLPIPPSPLTFWLTPTVFFSLRNVPSLLIKAMILKTSTIR